jgi:hypothetical protein
MRRVPYFSTGYPACSPGQPINIKEVGMLSRRAKEATFSGMNKSSIMIYEGDALSEVVWWLAKRHGTYQVDGDRRKCFVQIMIISIVDEITKDERRNLHTLRVSL